MAGVVVAAGVVLIPSISDGQALGTFRWQLQPFCNAVSVTVTQQGGTYTVDGFDDQCGAPQRAPLVGLATPNPDGSIGFGLHVVTVPGGRPVAIEARISLASLSGPWTDSAGNSGRFAFNGPGGGSPRPAPTVPVAALAPGAIGSRQINQAQVQTRFTGVCSKGHAITGVAPDGTARCTVVTTVADAVPGGGSGAFASIAIGADGLPIVSHWQSLSARLRVTHCGNAACTAGNVTTVADAPGYGVASGTSIAIGADGLPVIAHGATPVTRSVLRVTRCANMTCTSATSTNLDANAGLDAGQGASLAIGRDGFPVISHYSASGRALYFTRCSNADCTSPVTTQRLDQTIVDPGRFNAIAVGRDGLPLIAYSYASAGALRVAHCDDVACASATYTTVDILPGGVGRFASLAIGADGLPVIGHYDAGAQALRVTHCGNAACTAGNVSTTIDDGLPHVGMGAAIAIGADGLPLISHRNDSTGRVRVTHCGDVSCTAGVESRDVAPTGSFGDVEMALAIDGAGLPVMAHLVSPGIALAVTRCGALSCQ